MCDSEHAIQLARELLGMLREASLPVGAPAAARLRTKVCEYADELKANGASPERALVSVKDVLREAGFQSGAYAKSADSLLSPRDHLLVDVVSWCIRAYYASPTP